jgi:hypothetical protein
MNRIRPDDPQPASRARGARAALLLAGAALLAGPAWGQGGSRDQNARVLRYKQEEQAKQLAGLAAFHDFRFQDRVAESGITFRHRIVDDAGKRHKAVHYDHGNGMAIADVDGDGRHDVYFTTQLGSNELWKNLGGGKFRDVTREAGVGLADRVSVGASFADVDNDGDADLFVTTVRTGNVLLENDGKGVFRDISRAAGVDYSGHSSAAEFLDYDRDGLLDLFVCNVGVYTTQERGAGGYWVGLEDAFSGHLYPERAERSILYRNAGGNVFVDVTEQANLVDTSWSGDASPVDFNDDGWPDLYVLNMQGHDEYYENLGGRRFERKSRQVFPRTSWGAMGIKSFDYDDDGRMDLFITDMHSDMSQTIPPTMETRKSDMKWREDFLRSEGLSIFGNSLFRNLGEMKFQEVSDELGAENYWPWGVSAGDLNADGYEDVFVTASMNYPFRYGVNSLLLNDGGRRFHDLAFPLGVEPRRGERTLTPWFELDCSGADRGHKHCEGREGTIVVSGALGSRSSAIFDLDDDGDLDIVTNDFNSEPMVLVSNLTERTRVRFLKVRLQGTASNRDGLGARVQVRAGGRTYTRVHDGQSGYLSQSRDLLYFGLGGAERVDRIDVRWPSGRTQTLTEGIGVDRLLEIREEGKPPA